MAPTAPWSEQAARPPQRSSSALAQPTAPPVSEGRADVRVSLNASGVTVSTCSNSSEWEMGKPCFPGLGGPGRHQAWQHGFRR